MMAFIILAPILLLPLFNKFEPAPPGPIREAVVELAQANGVPSDKIYIYNGSKQSNAYTANVTGLFGTAQVSMSDVMFAKGADVPEVRAVLGHEMGHYVQRHVLWAALGTGLMTLVGFFLVDKLFPMVRVLTRAKGVGIVSDPAGLPIIGMVLTVLGLLAVPLQNAVSRQMEAAADRFSMERVNEPDGLSRALVKTIEHRAATPAALEEAIFYSHPAVGTRIRRAMEWKAAHMPPEPKPTPPTP
jgi:STE24 endopeptidase